MKSALERALERAEKLGPLSPEEKQRAKEEEYSAIGQGVAQQYLQQADKVALVRQIEQYKAEEREIVCRAVLTAMLDKIELDDQEITARALEGLAALQQGEDLAEALGKIRELLAEYQQTKLKALEKGKSLAAKAIQEELHRLRISGSAVGQVNLKVSPAWDKLTGRFQPQFNERLAHLKQELKARLG